MHEMLIYAAIAVVVAFALVLMSGDDRDLARTLRNSRVHCKACAGFRNHPEELRAVCRAYARDGARKGRTAPHDPFCGLVAAGPGRATIDPEFSVRVLPRAPRPRTCTAGGYCPPAPRRSLPYTPAPWPEPDSLLGLQRRVVVPPVHPGI